MWIRSQGTFEEYRKIRQGYKIDNRKIFGEYAEDVIGVKERAGVKHNTIYEKLHKEKEMMEAKMLLPSLFLIRLSCHPPLKRMFRSHALYSTAPCSPSPGRSWLLYSDSP